MAFELPVLLVIWRRAEPLRQVMHALRQVKPTRLFVAGDGPDPARPGESAKVFEARQVIAREVDWNCQLECRYAEKNQGCRQSVSGAIDWFFQHVDEGIILEDDCLPHPDFFFFCRFLLECYRHDEQVGCVTGNNFQSGQMRGKGSYYFSRYPHCWGWATWRRAWKHYASSVASWPDWRKSRAWRETFPQARKRRHWERVMQRQLDGGATSWSYVWMAALWQAGCITATPQANLVQNIGFSDEGTHTVDASLEAKFSIPARSLGEVCHPPEVRVDQQADDYVFETIFCPERERPRRGFLRATTRFLKFFRKTPTQVVPGGLGR